MRVNGTDIYLEKPQTLLNFLNTQNYIVTLIAVEHNGNIIPKEKYKDVILHAQDTLEVVNFVGGG